METFDCILIHPPKMNNRYKPLGPTMYVKYMPIGLLALADNLDRNGHRAQVIHLGVEYVEDRKNDVIDYIKKTRSPVVGISLHWHPQSYDAIEFARALKQRAPEIYVVLGGLSASWFAGEIMEKFPFINGVIRGDGELPIVNLVAEIKKNNADLSGIPNLVWRRNGLDTFNDLSYVADQRDIDDLNCFRFELMKNSRTYIDIFGRSAANYMILGSKKLNTMRRKTSSVVLPIARGCSVNCTWCGGSQKAHWSISGRREYLFRSPDRIVDDIRSVMQSGFGFIHFVHYADPEDTVYYVALFKKIREVGIRIGAFFECSALPTKELIDSFSETFSETENRTMCLSRIVPNETVRKTHAGNPYTNDELFATLAYLRDKNVLTELTFTIGMPGENEDDVPKLVAFRKEILQKFSNIKSSVVLTNQIEPGAAWLLNPDEFRIKTELNTFSDFYTFNKTPNSYYTHLGYRILGYFKNKKCDTFETFRRRIQKIRCRRFCLMSGNSTWPGANSVGRFKCQIMAVLWTILGFLRKARPLSH